MPTAWFMLPSKKTMTFLPGLDNIQPDFVLLVVLFNFIISNIPLQAGDEKELEETWPADLKQGHEHTGVVVQALEPQPSATRILSRHGRLSSRRYGGGPQQ